MVYADVRMIESGWMMILLMWCQSLECSHHPGESLTWQRTPHTNDKTFHNTFQSYGGCVDQRYAGAMEAGKLGAVGVIVRSMNLRLDDFPHTGSMTYGDLPVDQRIPSAAISTNHAELLSGMLSLDKNLKFYFLAVAICRSRCQCSRFSNSNVDLISSRVISYFQIDKTRTRETNTRKHFGRGV